MQLKTPLKRQVKDHRLIPLKYKIHFYKLIRTPYLKMKTQKSTGIPTEEDLYGQSCQCKS